MPTFLPEDSSVPRVPRQTFRDSIKILVEAGRRLEQVVAVLERYDEAMHRSKKDKRRRKRK